jgi:hypothetical protein
LGKQYNCSPELLGITKWSPKVFMAKKCKTSTVTQRFNIFKDVVIPFGIAKVYDLKATNQLVITCPLQMECCPSPLCLATISVRLASIWSDEVPVRMLFSAESKLGGVFFTMVSLKVVTAWTLFSTAAG